MPRRSRTRRARGRSPTPSAAAPPAPASPAAPDAAAPGGSAPPRPRWACLDVPALPLQLLARRHPDWAGRPLAVVDRDHPQGKVLWLDERAHTARVRPGQRYAEALLLCRDLCAGAVATADVDRAVERLVRILARHAPAVEPAARDTSDPTRAAREPGLFWLDVSGLTPLHDSLSDWAEGVRDALAAEGLVARVAVGFTRFGTYAGAKAPPPASGSGGGPRTVTVFPGPDTERRHLLRTPLDRLALDPDLRGGLARLGVHAVGELLALPEGGLRRRFGDEAGRWRRRAAGTDADPLAAAPVERPIRDRLILDWPETDAQRLLFLVKRLLHPLLARLRDRRLALREVRLVLGLEDGTHRTERLRPAAPTLDAGVVLDLVRLRLEALRLPARRPAGGAAADRTPLAGAPPAGVESLVVDLAGIPAEEEQLALFREEPRRDLAAADRALARLRADLGDDAVVRAVLREGHLPEARFAWEPLEHARLPQPHAAARPPLVRRLHAQPRRLPPRLRDEPDGWLLEDFAQGPVDHVRGPYVVSGGWWVRAIHRDYHYLATRRGDVLWTFYDRRRRRWYVQGRVE